MRLAVADRNRHVGDPEFVKVPTDKLVLKEYAAERRKLIHMDSTIAVATAGDFGQAEETNTTHLNVADAEGNMVSLTQTLGDFFGSHLVAADTAFYSATRCATYTWTRMIPHDWNPVNDLGPTNLPSSSLRMGNPSWRSERPAATASGSISFR